jgi:hypothetical protein
MTSDDETPVTDRPTPPYAARVSAEWAASAAQPVAGRAGERLVATARVEEWRETPGWTWRWCRDGQGREGWAPEALLEIAGATGAMGVAGDAGEKEETATLREDYDARELTVAVGARLAVERELAGWALCQAEDGPRGWVPLACLTPTTN